MLAKLKSYWNTFETWVNSWMPGFKTLIVSGIGAVASGAGVLQEYVSGLPLDQFMTATQIAIGSGILFTLAFWLHGIGARTDAE